MNSLPEFDRPDQAVSPTRLPSSILELGEALQRRERLRLVWKELNDHHANDPNVCLLLKDIEREAFFLDLWIAIARNAVVTRAGR